MIDTTEWRLAGGEKVHVILIVDALSRYCSALMAESAGSTFHAVRFYERALREGEPVDTHADGGVWYLATSWNLAVGWEWKVGEVRSTVGRWNETLKARTRSFEEDPPCRKTCNDAHVLRCCSPFGFYHNHMRRRHSPRNRLPLPVGYGRLRPEWGRFVEKLTESPS